VLGAQKGGFIPATHSLRNLPLRFARGLAMFKEFGLLYRPASVSGWLLTLLAVAFCIHIFRFVDSHSHSAADTLYGIFPYVVPTLLGLYVLAMRTCQQRT